jgi:PncC family amidohydrolase
MVGGRLTAVPGSSRYFLEGRVTYADEAKTRLLGVPPSLLRRKGAVSRECALAMARGLRRYSGADWTVSVTGIAGPGGGTAEKPVGLVFAAVAGPSGARAWRKVFPGGRERVRRESVRWTLSLLERSLRGGK